MLVRIIDRLYHVILVTACCKIGLRFQSCMILCSNKWMIAVNATFVVYALAYETIYENAHTYGFLHLHNFNVSTQFTV